MPDEDMSKNTTARILALVALACWGVSLLLPGFWTGHHSADKWSGLDILLTGTLFGWMAIGGWAVYANLFFLHTVIRAYQNRPAPQAATLMLLLASGILFFEGPIHPGLGSTMTIDSWGWGAVLWGVSLLTGMAASAYAALPSNKPPGKGHIALLVAIAVAVFAVVGGVRYHQWDRANAQDRALLLPPLAAFTVSEICKAPFTDAPVPLIPNGERVTVEVDEALTTKGLPDFGALPSLGGITREEGLNYVTYKNIPGMRQGFEMLVQVPQVSTRFVLRAERTNSGALLQLRDLHANKVLYEQPLAILRFKNGYSRYCPSLYNPSNRDVPGVRKVLEKLVDPQPEQVFMPSDLVTEAVRESCAVVPIIFPSGDNSKEWIKWEGRRLNLFNEKGLARSPGFCSKNYAGLVHVDMIDVGEVPHVLSVEVLLFERANLQPIARFHSDTARDILEQARQQNPYARSYRAPESIVVGFTVSSAESLTIHTQNGDIAAQIRW